MEIILHDHRLLLYIFSVRRYNTRNNHQLRRFADDIRCSSDPLGNVELGTAIKCALPKQGQLAPHNFQCADVNNLGLGKLGTKDACLDQIKQDGPQCENAMLQYVYLIHCLLLDCLID